MESPHERAKRLGIEPKEYLTREAYGKLHNRCPVCQNNKIGTTFRGCIEIYGEDYKDDNSVWCNECGWSGISDDLIK